MKILFADLDREWRGGQSQAFLTVTGLRAAGHDAHLVTVRDSPLAKRAAASGVPIHVVAPKARRIAATFLLRRLLAEESFSILHANEPHALSAAWLAAAHKKLPIVISRRVAYPLQKNAFSRKRYAIPSRIIAISQFVKASVVDSGVPPEKISIVYEGVDVPPTPTAAARFAARQRWGVSEDDKLFGCVGYLLPEKGQEIALRALATVCPQFPSARLLFAGDGPCRPALETLAQQLGLQGAIIFAGFVQDVTQIYSALDVFVFPSLAEPLGTSLLAAMAWELPVVAVASGGVPEYVVDSANGLLAPHPTPELFAQKMSRLLEDDSLRNTLGQAARRTIAETFSAKLMAKNTLRIYEEVLHKK